MLTNVRHGSVKAVITTHSQELDAGGPNAPPASLRHYGVGIERNFDDALVLGISTGCCQRSAILQRGKTGLQRGL